MDDAERIAILSQFSSDELFTEWVRRSTIEMEKAIAELLADFGDEPCVDVAN